MVKTWKVWMDNGLFFLISNEEQQRLDTWMNTRGGSVARWRSKDGFYIFVNHISAITPEEIEEVVEKVAEEVVDTSVDEVKEKIDKAEETLKMMMERSSCTHESESLYKQDTKTGLKYFPVCDKCFRRGRFVKAEKLTQDQMDAAIEWVDKE